MKASNLTAPRTLADCVFTTGYTTMDPTTVKERRFAGVLVFVSAVAIVGLAVVGALRLAWVFYG